MAFLKNSVASKNILLIAGDIVIAIASAYAGALIRFYDDYDFLLSYYSPLMPKVITFAIFIVVMCFFTDIYSTQRQDKREVLLKLVIGDFLAFIALGTLYYFVPYLQLGRGILSLSIGLTVLLQSVWHEGYAFFQKLPALSTKVLILGTGPIAQTIGNLLRGNNNSLVFAGYVNCVGEPVNVPRDNIIGESENLLDIAQKEKVQKIVVSLSERRGTFPVKEVLTCKLQGIEIIDCPTFFEQMTGKLLIENMNPSHLIFSEGFRLTNNRRYMKRIFDVLTASLGLVLSIPYLIVIPILIKLDSKGPIFFRQKRVGEGERNFTLFKFRTMVEGAEKGSGPVWSQTGDTRITRIGKFLRKTRIDEVPQLFNVLRGDMSFIGPRPERPFFVESLKKQIPYYSERHYIKPGVTGWAQVKYEYGDSIEDAIEKLRYDLYYLKYQSVLLDLLIILNTMKVVFQGWGGR